MFKKIAFNKIGSSGFHAAVLGLTQVFAAALLLRLGAAVLTQHRPIFPDFYYTDAKAMDLLAAEAFAAEKEGRAPSFNGTQSQLVQLKIQTALYRLAGPRPLAMKIFNAVLGALACVVLAAALMLVFAPGPSLTAAFLCAAWPSNIFFTSQNFKEAPTNLLAYLAFWAFLYLLAGKTGGKAGRLATAAGLFLALTAAALYRAYLLPVMAASMAFSAAPAVLGRRVGRAGPAWLLAAALAAPALYAPASRRLTGTGPQDPNLRARLLPVSWGDGHRPTTPAGITEFRRLQQEVDRDLARRKNGREIASQIFPGARFKSWLDVALFLPKGAFYALFMPLPGLYPMEGRIGRVLAGLENLLLLALCALGLLGALRGPKTAGRLFLIVFFCGMAAGSGLLEPDLGSAARHKLLFMPLLFAFAAEQIQRLLKTAEGKAPISP